MMNPLTRRRLLQSLPAALLAGSSVRNPAFAVEDDNPERTGVEFVNTAAQQGIDKGLAFLATRQQEDGAFGPGGYNRDVAVSALAGMAFIASGSTPGRGPYGSEVDLCIKYIIDNAQDSGYINAPGSGSHGPMYGHGFATLFLAECYGMTERADVREKLSRAVHLIVNTQNAEGGWRYQPVRREADLSVTICQVMAVVAMYTAGIYEGPEVEKGLAYVMDYLPQGGGFNRESHYFYGHYYAMQAMWIKGGEYWRKWYPAVRDELLARQRSDGSWVDSICQEYGTAMACIILQIPNNFLPIFQR